MMLEPYITLDRTLVLPHVDSLEALFDLIAATAVESAFSRADASTLKQALIEREQQTSTSMPDGVAFPHALLPDLNETVVVVVRLDRGVSFGAGHPPSDLILSMIGGTSKPWDHVKLLARLARLVHTEEARARFRAASDAAALFETLVQQDREHA